MATTLRVLFTGGGSGGPTTPLLAVNEALGALGPTESRFLGTTSGPERAMVEEAGVPFYAIPAGKLRRYFSWQNFTDPFRILAGGIIGLKHLAQFKPHVVVSAGSFVSVPVAYAARALGIPQVLLQMDVLPGLANRLMAPASSALGYYFPASKRAFQRIPERQHVGPVVRNSVYQGDPERANQRFQLNPDLPVLLITGGGQGAVGLNRAIQPLLPTWQEDFQVIHLTGRGSKADLANSSRYQAHEFVNEGMGDLLARSQLIITRSGLGILGELAILGKDVILVPLPNSHQELNASSLAEAGAITLLNQQELAENGSQWWSKFWSTYQPGITGQRMQSYWPPQGTTVFASLIRQQGLRAQPSSRAKRGDP